ncbi:MAG: hypothetical protein ACP5UM_15235, partial [Anaerolineae bacterium]
LDYTEGPILHQVSLIVRGVQTYQPLSPDLEFMIAYPPVWAYLLAGLVPLTGLALWPGRLVATLAALGSAGLLAWMVARETRDRAAGAVSGLLFLGIPYVLATSSIGRSDAWALLMSLAGVATVWKTRGRGWGGPVSVLFFLLAGYTRQSNLLAGPLSAYGGLFFRGERKRAVALAAALAVAVVVVFVTLNAWTNGGLYFNTMVVPRDDYHLGVALSWVLRVVRTLPVLVGLAVFFLALRLADGRLDAPVLYLLGAGATVLLAGKTGAHVNYLLEFCAALAWVAGLLWSQVRWEGFPALRGKALLAALLAVQVVGGLSTAQGLLPKLWHYREMVAEGRELERWIQEADGPVVADAATAYLVLKGQDPIWQTYGHASLVRRGLWDQGPFVDRIRRGEFALIIVQPDIAAWNWTPEMLAAIAERYHVVAEVAGQKVYAPR